MQVSNIWLAFADSHPWAELRGGEHQVPCLPGARLCEEHTSCLLTSKPTVFAIFLARGCWLLQVLSSGFVCVSGQGVLVPPQLGVFLQLSADWLWKQPWSSIPLITRTANRTGMHATFSITWLISFTLQQYAGLYMLAVCWPLYAH